MFYETPMLPKFFGTAYRGVAGVAVFLLLGLVSSSTVSSGLWPGCLRPSASRDLSPHVVSAARASAPRLALAALEKRAEQYVLAKYRAQQGKIETVLKGYPVLAASDLELYQRYAAAVLEGDMDGAARDAANIIHDEFLVELDAELVGGESLLSSPAKITPVGNANKHSLSLAAEGKGSNLWVSALDSWQKKDWSRALTFLNEFEKQKNHSGADVAAISYWKARAHQRLGQRQEAHRALGRAAAQPHSFYSLLARQQLGQMHRVRWHVPVLSPQQMKVLLSQRAGRVALFWLQFGDVALAESALRRADVKKDPKILSAVHALAAYAGMARLQMDLAGHRTQDEAAALAASYPVLRMDGVGPDEKPLLLAIARHESGFDARARSHKGAEGLMQVMPATAVAMKAKNVNGMDVGRLYVHSLKAQRPIGHNLIYLLSAYNAGPGKLREWQSRLPTNDPLLFLELIPYRETRDYVRQVVASSWLYADQLGIPLSSLQQLAAGQWPMWFDRAVGTRVASLATATSAD